MRPFNCLFSVLLFSVFLLGATCSQSRCSTRLSYTPTEPDMLAGSRAAAMRGAHHRTKVVNY
jgi:hypothetical protein